MIERVFHDFGIVDDRGDLFEFHCDDDQGNCRLDAIVLTERGPRRTEIAIIPTAIWSRISARVIRELVAGMGETERSKKNPTIKSGANRLSPLLGRELAVLLWTLMEEGAESNLEAILHSWRELAREERWWLFAKASVPGQRAAAGWRRALFHALSEIPNTRSSQTLPEVKIKPWECLAAQPADPTTKEGGTNETVPAAEERCKEQSMPIADQTTTRPSGKRKKKSKKNGFEGEGNQLRLF